MTLIFPGGRRRDRRGLAGLWRNGARPSGLARRRFSDSFDAGRKLLVAAPGDFLPSSLRSFFAFRPGRGVLEGRDRMVDDIHNLRIEPFFGYGPAAARKHMYWNFAIAVRQWL